MPWGTCPMESAPVRDCGAAARRIGLGFPERYQISRRPPTSGWSLRRGPGGGSRRSMRPKFRTLHGRTTQSTRSVWRCGSSHPPGDTKKLRATCCPAVSRRPPQPVGAVVRTGVLSPAWDSRPVTTHSGAREFARALRADGRFEGPAASDQTGVAAATAWPTGAVGRLCCCSVRWNRSCRPFCSGFRRSMRSS